MASTPQPLNPARAAKLAALEALDVKIARLSKQNPKIVREAFLKRYAHDAPAFVRDAFRFLPGEKPAAYQMRALENLMVSKRLAVRALHGTGKSTLASWVIIWGVQTADDVKVPTTASVWRQLEKYLWPEVHKWMQRFRWEITGREKPRDDGLNVTGMRLSPTAEAFAAASDRHEFIEGAHAKRIVYVFDESKAIPPKTWDAAEGAFTGAGDCEAFALAVSTPGEPAGRFYDICSRKRGYEDWGVMHVTLADAIAAGRVSQKWADQRKLQWGENSPMYQNRVLGNFATSESNGIIPLSWVEAANERWNEWKDAGGQIVDPVEAVGVDVARSGDDMTILSPRSGNTILDLIEYSKQDTMTTTGCVVQVMGRANLGVRAVVDVIGVGAGVVDRLNELGYDVDAFNASESTDVTDKSGELGFVNKRSAAWWNMRELLDPESGANVMLPPNDNLIGDLCAPTWGVTSSGKIKLESKDDIKKRIGRSTDHGDTVVQAFWKGEAGKNLTSERVVPQHRADRFIQQRRGPGPLM